MRKDAAGMNDRKKKLPHRNKGSSNNSSVEDVRSGDQNIGTTKKPLIAKWKPGVKLQMACSENDGMSTMNN